MQRNTAKSIRMPLEMYDLNNNKCIDKNNMVKNKTLKHRKLCNNNSSQSHWFFCYGLDFVTTQF